MGYTEAVYYMLNGGLDKYIIEQLEVTDTWKHDFIAPGYATQSTELCVGWDEVTVEVPTTALVTVTKDSTTYTPVSPSKGYKSVKVQIAYGGEHTFNENGDWTFGEETEFATEAFKTITAAVPIKASDSITQNHTTKTYPDGSGNIGVREVNVNVRIYTQEEIDELIREAEEAEEDCDTDPIPPEEEEEDEQPVEPIPPVEIVEVFPDPMLISGLLAFKIFYKGTPKQDDKPYAFDFYSSSNSYETRYYDYLIIFRFYKRETTDSEWEIIRDYELNYATSRAPNADTGGPNRYSHTHDGVVPHVTLTDFYYEIVNNGETHQGIIHTDIHVEHWEGGSDWVVLDLPDSQTQQIIQTTDFYIAQLSEVTW